MPLSFQFDPDSLYITVVEPIMFDLKYYFVFAGSALNPILYGYGNENMRKAFRITFTWLYREKVKYFTDNFP